MAEAAGEENMLYVIVNPKAQSGRTGKLWEKVEARLKEKNAEYEQVKAENAGGLMGQVAQLTKPVPAGEGEKGAVDLLVIGGDGTLNDVVSAVGDFSRVRVGLIPSGSGNDFARDLKLSKDGYKLSEQLFSASE